MIATLVWLAASVAIGSAETGDPASIGQLLRGMFDRPGDVLSVGPVVVSGDHAIADWTQGEMGGRALLRRSHGSWAVTLCAGDAIKSSEALKTAGVPQPDAIHLAQALASAESTVAPERLAMFARFEGLVTMDGTTAVGPAHAGHSR
jgi:hypothetical protein